MAKPLEVWTVSIVPTNVYRRRQRGTRTQNGVTQASTLETENRDDFKGPGSHFLCEKLATRGL